MLLINLIMQGRLPDDRKLHGDFAEVAQLAERRIPNPLVGGSNPSLVRFFLEDLAGWSEDWSVRSDYEPSEEVKTLEEYTWVEYVLAGLVALVHVVVYTVMFSCLIISMKD